MQTNEPPSPENTTARLSGPEQKRVKAKKNKPPKVYGLRPKRRKFAMAVGQGEVPTQAVREAGYNTKWPAQMANKMLKDEKVQRAVDTYRTYFDAKFSDERMAQKADQLMEAEVGDQPAWETQRKMWQDLAKMKGYFGTESHLHLHKNEFITELAEKAQDE